MQAVSRPEDAPWLLDPIDISLRDLDASEAIALLVGGRSLRFELRLTEMPRRLPTRATLIDTLTGRA